MTHSALLMLSVCLTLFLLSACGPVSMADAERWCSARASAASGPHGEVTLGMAGGKPSTRMTLDVSSDYLMDRDPSTVFDQCVLQKTGKPPSQPLYARTDWNG
jgi:hypothetical protein